jgi:hypothetical protein
MSGDVGRQPTIDGMSGPHPRSTAATLGVAGVGLVLGHWLAYALDTPHAPARDEMLRATGHGYLPFLIQVALLGAAIGLAGLFAARVRRREGPGAFTRDAARLAAVQAGAFVAMEAAERLLSGASLHDLTHGPLLAIGLGAQLAVAVAGASLLRVTDRVAEGADVLVDLAAPSPPPLVAAVPVMAGAAPRRPTTCRVASRAPPSPA